MFILCCVIRTHILDPSQKMRRKPLYLLCSDLNLASDVEVKVLGETQARPRAGRPRRWTPSAEGGACAAGGRTRPSDAEVGVTSEETCLAPSPSHGLTTGTCHVPVV